MVLIIEGMPYFAFPEKLKIYLVKIAELPAVTLRIMGMGAMAIGLILLYLGRN